MPGHTRVYRRGAVCFHRAAVPQDIRDSHGKIEEAFSPGTKDHQEARKKVKVAAVEVDRKFDQHREWLRLQNWPVLPERSDEQIKHIGEVYFIHLLEEDDTIRGEGFRDRSFEEWAEQIEEGEEGNRHHYARGEVDYFFDDTVVLVLRPESCGP